MTIDKDTLDSVLRRIQKLLAIAADDRANPEEAASAAAMAEKTMRKYQLDHMDVVMAGIKKREGMTEECVLATALRPHEIVRNVPLWAQFIAVQVAKLMDVYADTHFQRPHRVIRFRGFESDVKIAAWQYSYLVATVNRLCTDFKKTDAYLMASSQKVMNSYRMGVAQGICDSLKAALESKTRELGLTGGAAATSGSLMVIAKTQAVAEYVGREIEYGTTRSQTSQGSAYRDGRRDGRAVDVNRRAVGNSQSTKRIEG